MTTNTEEFRMRRVMAVLSVMTMVALAAGSVQAGYVTPEWDYNTNDSPTATSRACGGSIRAAGQALPNRYQHGDIGGTTESDISLLYAGTSPAILLVSDHSGYGGYGDITWNGPGLFCPGAVLRGSDSWHDAGVRRRPGSK